MAAPSPDPTSLRGLLTLLISQGRELARLYTAAARQEVELGLNHLRAGIVLLAVALGLAAVAIMVLVLLLVAGISALSGLPLWLSALIVLAVVMLLIAVLAWLGWRQLRQARMVPDETIAAVKEDLEWAQHWTRRG